MLRDSILSDMKPKKVNQVGDRRGQGSTECSTRSRHGSTWATACAHETRGRLPRDLALAPLALGAAPCLGITLDVKEHVAHAGETSRVQRFEASTPAKLQVESGQLLFKLLNAGTTAMP